MLNDQLLQCQDLKNRCYSCGKTLEGEEWASSFADGKHYKSLVCSCGSQLRVSVGFMGSGHDGWDGTNGWMKKSDIRQPADSTARVRTLENKVQRMKPV